MEKITDCGIFCHQLKSIADGKSIPFNSELNNTDILENIVQLLNNSILMLLPPARVILTKYIKGEIIKFLLFLYKYMFKYTNL